MKTGDKQDSKRTPLQWWHVMLVGAVVASTVTPALLGSREARGAEACLAMEFVNLTDPVVTVIEGPLDATSEQAQWSMIEFPQLEAPLAIVLDHRTFELEHLP
jgi:hypothetical protein